jgi:signal transduction histidine kinase
VLLAKSAEARLAENGSSTPLADDVRLIQQVVGDALGWTRNLSRHLSSTPVTDDGLLPALQDLATNVERLFGVRCATSADAGLRSPPPVVCAQLYRIAQEAITNAVKHGHASRIDVAWHARGADHVLEIRDAGCGLTQAQNTTAAGIGLHVMRSRAALIGGQLTIESPAPDDDDTDARGVLVRCTFPPRFLEHV